ncbi:hypothetical protein BC941DRAFT_467327 [Chlamydoabsidia padenii]|nr:hypothetical protein BC941DRAFT_467327 [Chlamydoabsidia padenii]
MKVYMLLIGTARYYSRYQDEEEYTGTTVIGGIIPKSTILSKTAKKKKLNLSSCSLLSPRNTIDALNEKQKSAIHISTINTHNNLEDYSVDTPDVTWSCFNRYSGSDVLIIEKRTQNDACHCLFAFGHNDTIFIVLPGPGQPNANNSILTWSSKEFQSWLMDILEMRTGCHYLVVALNRLQDHNAVETLPRAFCYIGFQLSTLLFTSTRRIIFL